MSASIEQRNQDATVYIGNLDEKVQEELLWELMLQCGPVINVHMPKDKVTGKHLNYGFVEFRGEEDAEYCMKVMNMIKLHGKALKVNKASQDKRQTDVGANIFIGNLDLEIDEKSLYDTFSAFGGILQTPKIMRDVETGISKGYGFVSYESFDASDLAIESMNGQYLANRVIVVQYAFKKDSQGERHGSQAERLLAASQPQRFKPHVFFSGGSGEAIVNMGSTATLAGMQMQQQQQQLQQQMQLSAYGAMAYGQMPMSMQMPTPMMPGAPSALSGYMQQQQPQQQQPQFNPQQQQQMQYNQQLQLHQQQYGQQMQQQQQGMMMMMQQQQQQQPMFPSQPPPPMPHHDQNIPPPPVTYGYPPIPPPSAQQGFAPLPPVNMAGAPPPPPPSYQ